MAMTEINDPLLFCSQLMGVDPSQILSSPDKVNQAILAETIRIAIDNVRSNDVLNATPVHILTIRSWVTRKLRFMMPNLVTGDDEILKNHFEESLSSNLLFIGDIIKLDDGSIIPSPSRAIQLHENRFLLISGLPTKYFTNIGFKVEIVGTIRHLVISDSSTFVKINMPTQQLDSYLARYQRTESVSLNEFLEKCQLFEWRSDNDFEGYVGVQPKSSLNFDKNEGSFGFRCWGGTPLEVNHPMGQISIWRNVKDWGAVQYWIRLRRKKRTREIRQEMKNGRMVNVVYDHDNLAALIPNDNFKQFALDLESISGNPRTVEVFLSQDRAIIETNFFPFVDLFHWICITGGYFAGYAPNHVMKWILPKWALLRASDIIKSYRIIVNQKRVGGENGID
jgi:hypothetical protein